VANIAKPRQNEATPKEQRQYLRDEHLRGEHRFVTSMIPTWPERPDNNRVVVQYTLEGNSRKSYKTPRGLTMWLDDRSDEFVRRELNEWKETHNLRVPGNKLPSHVPDFWRRDIEAFTKWARGSGAGTHTTVAYVEGLQNHVFPFFCRRLGVDNVREWHRHYVAWSEYLEKVVPALSTRNKLRTALRRYLKFLKAKRGFSDLHLPTNEKHARQTREGQILPGNELPSYDKVGKWFDRLPRGRARWIIGLCIAFGTRIGEAIVARPTDLFGAGDVEDLKKESETVRRLLSDYRPFAFLRVNKTGVTWQINKELQQLLPKMEWDENGVKNRTKTGDDYMAVCFDAAWATRILDMYESEDFAGDEAVGPIYQQVLKIITESGDDLFSQYRPHDFRRLSITHKLNAIQEERLVGRMHGQVSPATLRRYYQWALEVGKKDPKKAFRPIEYPQAKQKKKRA
jgi:hypothetical protein